jgi:hypothetical protein
MRNGMQFSGPIILAVLTATQVAGFAFVSPRADTPRRMISKTRMSAVRSIEMIDGASSRHDSDPPVVKTHFGVRLWKRMDTLDAAGLRHVPTATSSPNNSKEQKHSAKLASSSIGFFGHSGLFLLSTIIVSMVKRLMPLPPTTDDEPKQQQAGIMNRCPWPFIFFHDPKEGFKDSPTWVTLVWIALWRGWKYYLAAKNKVGVV